MDRQKRREIGAKAGEKRECGFDDCEATVSKCRYAEHILEEHSG